MVVVACRVFIDGIVGFGIDLPLHGVEVVGVDAIVTLVFVSQTIETNILLLTCTAFVGERIDHGLLAGHTSPSGLGIGGGGADGHTAFVEFLAVLQHVFADVAKVDVEVTSVVFAVRSVDERVEHPELDVLDVAGLEVAGVHLSHHTSPAFLWVVQLGICVHVGVEVVRTALIRIVCQVQDTQRVALSHVGVSVGIDLAHIDLAHIVVGELIQVALDVSWGEG